ncbi:amino acid deaminase [Lysobacter gummosus]|uniref:Amino acid deaminase n=1 Tax=Lysobacter gummosus TaxID=262324 RepID=A0ABY3X8N6_9GAMM|nr:amino acid deaminase [Lysobacter gummosus]ALN93504.1 putative D-serine deaminase (D-serine dehydratase) protein [Lysobacter gummosus]UNP28953.1 amino acid deaminase [Lysobacter gummosus]
MNDALRGLERQLIHPGTKGLALQQPLRQNEIAALGLNVLDGRLSYPVAVLRQSTLDHNIAWMREFVERADALLAPHGKTTMSPQLFQAQLDAGAWAITLATVPQLRVAHRFGVKRVLLANQPVAMADIESLAALLREEADFHAWVLVDSSAGAARLNQVMQQMAPQRRLPVLVELGAQGGRSGVRGADAALELAREIHAASHLSLAGIEGYEGLWVGADRADDLRRVEDLLAQMVELTRRCDAQGLFDGEEILLSAGGSAYFDFVARAFAGLGDTSRPLRRVLRSGCYLTSDHGFYHGLQQEMRTRHDASFRHGLQPALEVWAMVQSRPEPGLALLTLGKRDASYDIDLPRPLSWHRPGETAPRPMRDTRIVKMNDQHAYLELPPEHPLRVGDLVATGISHPCTTFDKWPLMLLTDDHYRVTGAINTFF